MARPLLVIDSFNGTAGVTPVPVYRLVGADPTIPGSQIGSAIGVAENASSLTGLMHSNACLHYAQYLYAWVGRTIYRYDEDNPTDDWQLVHTTATEPSAGRHLKSGLYTFLIDGIPHICGFGATRVADASAIQYFKINAVTGAVAESGFLETTNSFGTAGIRAVGVYKNRIFWSPNTTNQIEWWDVINDVIGVANMDTAFPSSGNQIAFCNWNGQLFLFGQQGSGSPSNAPILLEYDYGSNVFGLVWTSTRASGVAQLHKPAMWVQDGDLYILHYARDGTGGTGDGWFFYRFAAGTTLIEEDITDQLPVDLTPPSYGGNLAYTSTQRWTVDVNQELGTAGGVEVSLYLYSTGATGGTLSLYDYDGSAVNFVDSGPNSSIVLPRETDGGGERAWTSGDITPEIREVEVLGATVRVTFIVRGGGTRSIQLLFTLGLNQPETVGTLTNPSAGVVTGGTDLEGLTADGTTEYTVEWAAQTDGVIDFDFVNFVLSAF